MLRKLPATFLATSLTVVYGLINTKALGLYRFASMLEGPLPIERPNSITSSRAKPRPPLSRGRVTYSKSEIAHFLISLAFGVNFFFV